MTWEEQRPVLGVATELKTIAEFMKRKRLSDGEVTGEDILAWESAIMEQANALEIAAMPKVPKSVDMTAYINFRTNQPEPINWDDDEHVKQFISQDPAIQGIYRCHRGMGKSAREAFQQALESSIPKDMLKQIKG